MFHTDDTEAGVRVTIARLSSYLGKGISDCLERDRREAVSFSDGCGVASGALMRGKVEEEKVSGGEQQQE